MMIMMRKHLEYFLQLQAVLLMLQALRHLFVVNMFDKQTLGHSNGPQVAVTVAVLCPNVAVKPAAVFGCCTQHFTGR